MDTTHAAGPGPPFVTLTADSEIDSAPTGLTWNAPDQTHAPAAVALTICFTRRRA
jgi:hypothetical protein